MRCRPAEAPTKALLERGDIDMNRRGIVFAVGITLIALSGCATRTQTDAVARSTESDVRPSVLPSDIVGTWSGSFGPVGADAGGAGASGDFSLTIGEDGTYTATARRRASTRNYSGVVVANGRTITFRNSSGRSTSLVHRGDALYGVIPDHISGYTLQVSAVKNSGTLASPGSAPSDRQ
jgi:hypothetical protein